VSSILPNYEYDIFISYRQNDNKRDGWVTNFVAALKDELEATLKNPVTIYFDENPHDGLLETHQVNASLKKKLKCLVFIPIISQTYCDTKSFAWEHEFIAFNKIAKADELGMNISLANGNVASRVLPVKIHELDDQDKQVIEHELGGPLRCIDFIYSEPGVNRPLSPDDNEDKNLNKTRYKNQINKVANALKEIGTSILRHAEEDDGVPGAVNNKSETDPRQSKSRLNKYALVAILGTLLAAASLIAFLLPDDAKTVYDYDIAVMYLENLTDDDKYADGLINLIQINLAEDTSLNLVPRHKLYDALKDINEETGTLDRSVATELASLINTEFMIVGRVIQQGSEVLAQVELIEVATGKLIVTKKVQGSKDQIFALADNITRKLMAGRIPERKYDVTSLTTTNYDAYKVYYQGLEHMWNLEYSAASEKFANAIKLDSTFAMAYFYLVFASNPFSELDIYQDFSIGRPNIEKAQLYAKNIPKKEQLMIQWIDEYTRFDSSFIETGEKLIKIDPEDKFIIYMSTNMFSEIENTKLLSSYLEKNPNATDVYNVLAYHYLRLDMVDSALVAVANYLKFNPVLFNAFHSSWEINVMVGQFEVAKGFANQLETKFPEIGSIGTWNAFTNLVQRRPDECLVSFNSFRHKTFYRGLQNLGPAAYLMKGEISKAARTNDEVVLRYIENDYLARSREIQLNKSLIFMTGGNFSKAEQAINELIQEVSNESEYNPFTFIAYYYKGLNYIAKSDISSANDQLGLLVELLDNNKNDPRFSIYERLLAAEIALEEDNLLGVNSILSPLNQFYKTNNPRYYYIQLNYLIASTKYDEAVDYIDNIHRGLLSGRPGFGGNKILYTINIMLGDYYKGVIYEKQGKTDMAIDSFNSFLELLKDSDGGIKEKEDATKRLKALQESSTL